MALPNGTITRIEQYLSAIAGQSTELPGTPITRIEQYLDYIANHGSGGTSDYSHLDNLPSVNGNTIDGALTGSDLGLLDLSGGTMTGDVAMGGNKVTGLADGTADSDAVTKRQLDDAKVGALKPKGSITFAQLPAPSAAVLNYMYNISDGFTTTSDFVEGAGAVHPAGSNVAIINVGSDLVPVYKYDVYHGEIPDATTNIKGIVQLSSAVDSASETKAATPKAVKQTYDFATSELEALKNSKEFRGLYAGRDLGSAYSAEINASPYNGSVWAWIKGRIVNWDVDDLHVGDYIIYVTKDNYELSAVLCGIDTYRLFGDPFRWGHHIDFMSFKSLFYSHKWNNTNYNNGLSESQVPYMCSEIKAWLNAEQSKVPNGTTPSQTGIDVDYRSVGLYEKLPDDLQNVVVNKHLRLPKRYTSQSSEIALTSDTGSLEWVNVGKLWLPTEKEICGTNIYGSKYSAVGSRWYELFAKYSGNDATFCSNSSGSRTYWYTSTHAEGDSSKIVAFDISNTPIIIDASTELTVRFGFRIDSSTT